MDSFIAQIQPFGFNFAPRNWAMCNGQILSIAQNTALFSLLGTTYGGNGQTTFALPNLQSRWPLHFGQGPGLSAYALGQQAGSESVTMTINQLAAHAHAMTLTVSDAGKFQAVPLNNVIGAADIFVAPPPTPATATMAPQGNSGNTGGGQPIPILPPYLALNWCICLFGIFPSRN